MHPTELVGREVELSILGEYLDAALRGEPRLVLCRGEPGIGKTRLAQELAARATVRGVPAVWGRGVESDGAPPYWPWRQLLRATGEVVDLRQPADDNRLTADLGLLAPDLFPATEGVDAGTSEDRFRQFDAVGRLLRAVAARMPFVVVLDDVHWADQPSLLLRPDTGPAATAAPASCEDGPPRPRFWRTRHAQARPARPEPRRRTKALLRPGRPRGSTRRDPRRGA